MTRQNLVGGTFIIGITAFVGQYGHLIPSQEEALRQFKAAVPIEHVLLSKYSVETEEQVQFYDAMVSCFHNFSSCVLIRNKNTSEI